MSFDYEELHSKVLARGLEMAEEGKLFFEIHFDLMEEFQKYGTVEEVYSVVNAVSSDYIYDRCWRKYK